jgi:hypothetical protein
LKAEKQQDEAIWKAQKAIDDWIKKAEKALNRRGIDARCAERERKKKLAELQASGAFIPIDIYEPIRDPEKSPTPEDLETLKPHPSLTQALEALQPQPT